MSKETETPWAPQGRVDSIDRQVCELEYRVTTLEGEAADERQVFIDKAARRFMSDERAAFNVRGDLYDDATGAIDAFNAAEALWAERQRRKEGSSDG